MVNMNKLKTQLGDEVALQRDEAKKKEQQFRAELAVRKAEVEAKTGKLDEMSKSLEEMRRSHEVLLQKAETAHADSMKDLEAQQSQLTEEVKAAKDEVMRKQVVEEEAMRRLEEATTQVLPPNLPPQHPHALSPPSHRAFCITHYPVVLDRRAA